MFLVIIRLGEGLIDVDGAGRAGWPFADKEILYGKGGEEFIIPGSKAPSLWHDGGVRGRREEMIVDWSCVNNMGTERY